MTERLFVVRTGDSLTIYGNSEDDPGIVPFTSLETARSALKIFEENGAENVMIFELIEVKETE